MGQINMPVLNKAGNSVFWDVCFENSFNFSRDLRISLFCKEIVYLFFKDNFLKNFVFYRKKKIIKILNKYKNVEEDLLLSNFIFYLKNMYEYSSVIKYNLEKRINVYYSTKIFFIKYNKWIIITFRVYTPSAKDEKESELLFELPIHSFLWKQYYFNFLKKNNFFKKLNFIF